jgi:GNAT superfamily N-acetyltransferase
VIPSVRRQGAGRALVAAAEAWAREQALAKGLAANGYDVRIGTRTPGKLEQVSKSTGIREGNFQEVAAW